MQLTLRSARRLEREIGSQVEQSDHSSSARVSVSIYQNFDETIEATREKVVATLSTNFRLMDLRAGIRKAIESANEAIGLNLLINEEAVLKAKAKMLASSLTAEADLDITRQRHAAMVATGATPNAYGQLTDTIDVTSVMNAETLNVLKDEAKSIQRRLLKIVDDMTAINTTTAAVELSAEDVAFLEANNFVL